MRDKWNGDQNGNGQERPGKAEAQETSQIMRDLLSPYQNADGKRQIVHVKYISEDWEVLTHKYDLWNRTDLLQEMIVNIKKLRNETDRLNALMIMGTGILSHKENPVTIDLLAKMVGLLTNLPADGNGITTVKRILFGKFRRYLDSAEQFCGADGLPRNIRHIRKILEEGINII